jgi:hypothetical protein
LPSDKKGKIKSRKYCNSFRIENLTVMRSYNRETTVSLRCPEHSLLSEHNKMSLNIPGQNLVSC